MDQNNKINNKQLSASKALIGAHVSAAGGIQNAPARARQEGCEVFQCFTRPPQGGKAPVLTDSIIRQFKKEMRTHQIANFYIHAPYYVNLASLEPRIRESSIQIIREELERGTILSARCVMAHVGSHADQTLREGIAKVIDGINRILSGYAGATQFLIEISAGSGNVIGDTFQEIGDIMYAVKSLPGFGGVCFDTCHAFASGYDFRTPAGTVGVLAEFDRHIGIEWLKLTHVNDSKCDLGGKKDRHEHIGKGYIGQEGITAILSSERFKNIDWILETENSQRQQDIAILKEIRQIMEGYIQPASATLKTSKGVFQPSLFLGLVLSSDSMN